ncbi:hypothetical protein TNCV_4482701 [Trichonephila clavipes]|nr:hypothetical protein TNCV_4482701 [Trichonephila clavipes]
MKTKRHRKLPCFVEQNLRHTVEPFTTQCDSDPNSNVSEHENQRKLSDMGLHIRRPTRGFLLTCQIWDYISDVPLVGFC